MSELAGLRFEWERRLRATQALKPIDRANARAAAEPEPVGLSRSAKHVGHVLATYADQDGTRVRPSPERPRGSERSAKEKQMPEGPRLPRRDQWHTTEQAAEALGVPASIISSWKNRGRVMPQGFLRGSSRNGLVPLYSLHELEPLAASYRPRRHKETGDTPRTEPPQ